MGFIRKSSGQIQAMYSAISQCAELKLKSLRLEPDTGLLNVDLDTLARAFCRIVNVVLWECELTK